MFSGDRHVSSDVVSKNALFVVLKYEKRLIVKCFSSALCRFIVCADSGFLCKFRFHEQIPLFVQSPLSCADSAFHRCCNESSSASVAIPLENTENTLKSDKKRE